MHLLLALLAPLTFQAAAEETHPFSIEDMLAMQRVGEPELSPDGRWIAYSLRTTDLEANRGRFDVWLVATDGSSQKQLTSHPANDTSPRWAPDGQSLYFLSPRGGSSQVWKISLAGGEAEQVTRFALDVENLRVFPDGRRLLISFDVHPDAATLEDSAKRDAEAAKSKVSAKVYEQLFVRHWDTWEDKKRSHPFVWTLGGGEPLDLMKGIDADCPSKPFGGAEELAISPDGSRVAFAAKVVGREEAWSTNSDIWLAAADASTPAQNLTAASPGFDNLPAFSPDGKTLAHVSMARAGYEADRQRIVLIELASGRARVLTEAWDRSASEIVWSGDGQSIWTSADNVGQHSLFSIEVASGRVTTVVEQGTNANPLPHGQRVAFLRDTLAQPAELESCAVDGSDSRRLTRHNDARLAAARMGAFEQFSFVGAKNERVHGYLVRPVDFDPAKKYPIAFLIHGGPQGSFGNHFHYRWNPQAYAGAGYAAIMVDFHGSTGYGQAFSDAIRGDWGDGPFMDLIRGLDAALAKWSFLDGKRCSALGASYGGYMINWIAGHTKRFTCLVNHDGILDERMAYFDTEELWFPEWEHGGPPWRNEGNNYYKVNPVNFIEHWSTPMLVIHGGLDYRVVETQGIGTFNALQRRGIPSKLIYFPDENHWVLKPHNSRFWHQSVLAWLAQWNQP